MYHEINERLLSFIEKSPSCFHAVDEIKKKLLEEDFIELLEGRKWVIEKGKNYFVTRNNSSIIAFKVGSKLDEYRFHIAASHSDSPSFKIKENAEIESSKYLQLNTEGYGGMIASTWFDRPLSMAGRAVVKCEGELHSRLVNIDRDLMVIPNVAIHMNRNANDGMTYNLQIDTIPLFGSKECKGGYHKLIAEELNVKEEDIYGLDMFLYNRMSGSLWGCQEEFVSSAKLDDLQCAYASLEGFLKGSNDSNVNVYACFDNEEVGSSTKQGAASTLLYDVLHRINHGLGNDEEAYHKALASSFMMSCDNAHAQHPNHPEKSDSKNAVYMNEGIVVKMNANQKYTTDALSSAVCRSICEKAKVPFQFYANRSDMPGGSTLGNIASTQVSINSADIGLAQLAMHSAYETAGVKDTYYLAKMMEEFFNCSIRYRDSMCFMIDHN